MNIPDTLFAFIFHFIKKQRLNFSIIILAFVIWSFNDAFFPYLLKRIVNTVAHLHGDRTGIYTAVSGSVILVVLLWATSEIFMRLQGILQIYTFPKFRANIREAVFNHVKLHSQDYFANNFAGQIAKKLGDLPTSCQTIVEIICFQLVTITVGSIIVLTMMWFTHPLYAIILVIWMAIHLTIIGIFFRKSHKLAEVHSEAITVLNGKTVDIFTNILNVKLFSRTKYESDYLNQYQKEEIHKAKNALWIIEKMRMGLGINGLFLIFAMVFALLYGWTQHWVSIGDFTQVLMQSFWLLGWLWFLSFQVTLFARELGTIENALRLIKQKHELTDAKDAKTIDIRNGQIEFDNVCFAYKNNAPVFDHLNIIIKAGEKVGLVGFSGSGKSTFVNLILRFHDLNAGSINIDGMNIAKVTQDSLRKQISMIPQEPMLFHRSLMQNIRYGQLDATDEQVIAASKLAHCHEFIEVLDEGYHSMVGERGIKLSGGQRQRIAIARAILKNAPILILDEATSALDSVTEKLIQQSLRGLMKDRTTIVVAHRLSTLHDMDRILVFHQGRIIEQGTIEALLKLDKHFAKLWNMQTDGYLPEH